ncbi:hypothetical protein SARC_09015 [Sphaeroforma arctica JP610]|uniref:ABC transmembrane type-1 domain-containing protein n=1 Tax=Sphaeroforma arctica JP610 TaxID=667725 RepID=A0A0L0FRH7_9EUKA|nr:hypothetical protein SARC_09015 [Sphaeroforma arctica JP610]KNC78568.1 hypothetical protein SARC_09015 [Sphaeroforma arctica JP610]|eukprot:XP_014152470.1 hypothetical protein SARC_09015 [Sphaeroforma arctica JP610]
MLLSMCIGSLFPCFCVLFGQLLDGLSALVVDIAEQDPEQLITDVMKVDWRNLSEQATTNPLKVMSGVQGALGLLETLQIVTAGFDKLDQDVIRLAVILIIMGVIGGIAGVLQRVLLGYYIRPSMQRIRRLYLKSVLSQEIAFHDHHTGGELIAHATNDMSKIEGAIGDQLAFFFLLWGVTLSGLIIGLVTAWQIALVCIAFTPLIAGSGALMSRLVSKSVSQSSQEYASAAAMAEESLALIKTVTAFGGQKSEIQRFNDQVDSVQEKGIKRAYVYAFGTGLSLFVLFGSCSFIMWFAFDLVSNGTVGVGDAMTVFYAVVLAAIAMGQTFSSMEAIGQAR